MHPEPPTVTITNPNAPAGTANLLASGSERTPWRPSKGQWKGAVAALVGAALVGGTWTWIAHVRAERAADRAAIADVHLVAIPMSELGFGTVEANETLVGLRNDGRQTLHLVSVAVKSPFQATFSDGALLTGVPVGVRLKLRGGCRPALLNDPVPSITARVRTDRGQEVTRDLPINDETFDLGSTLRGQCGYLPLEASLNWNVPSSALHGRTLTLSVEAVNGSTLPLSVRRIQGEVPGLVVHLSSRLPLALPPSPAPDEQGRPVKLTMTVRVTDCAAFADYYSFSGDPSLGLRAVVVRGGESAEVVFAAWVPDPAAVPNYEGEVALIDAAQLLLHACGRG